MTKDEILACIPRPLNPNGFNANCILPYSLTPEHVKKSMHDFLGFLGFINQQLNTKDMPRLESFLMPANFSSMVGEYMNITIPKYCPTLVKNQYHNGHPDLIPIGVFASNAVQHSSEGIEIKGSRHLAGWQGHNAESVWLMVFVFDSNTPNDGLKKIPPKQFSFQAVYTARLELQDWAFSGRSATSRRTITASVSQNGVQKMKANWVYEDLGK
ncbi:MAG: hypothetical protein AB1846_04660 [Chloroflexota bacterium]